MMGINTPENQLCKALSVQLDLPQTRDSESLAEHKLYCNMLASYLNSTHPQFNG